jgi:predicted outer membrane repeat protein
LTYDCQLEISGPTTFSENTAGQSGGAIYWGEVEPKYNTFTDMKFSRNYAVVYANDIGSIPAKLVGLTEAQYQGQQRRAAGLKLRAL